MSQCLYCEWLSSKKNLLYEDEQTGVLLNPQPAAPGHLIVVPRKHYTIFEQVPPEENAALGIIANKMSIMLFETLQPAGTNLLIQNGADAGQTMPHVGVHLIPRFEGDGIDFSWKSRPLTEEQMAAVELGLRDALSGGDAPASHGEPHHEHHDDTHHKPHHTLHYPERIP